MKKLCRGGFLWLRICGLMEKCVKSVLERVAKLIQPRTVWLDWRTMEYFKALFSPHKSLGVKTNGICLETLKCSFSTVCCNDFGYLRRDIRLQLHCLSGTPREQQSCSKVVEGRTKSAFNRTSFPGCRFSNCFW